MTRQRELLRHLFASFFIPDYALYPVASQDLFHAISHVLDSRLYSNMTRDDASRILTKAVRSIVPVSRWLARILGSKELVHGCLRDILHRRLRDPAFTYSSTQSHTRYNI